MIDDDSATVGVAVSQNNGGGRTNNEGRAEDDVGKADGLLTSSALYRHYYIV